MLTIASTMATVPVTSPAVAWPPRPPLRRAAAPRPTATTPRARPTTAKSRAKRMPAIPVTRDATARPFDPPLRPVGVVLVCSLVMGPPRVGRRPGSPAVDRLGGRPRPPRNRLTRPVTGSGDTDHTRRGCAVTPGRGSVLGRSSTCRRSDVPRREHRLVAALIGVSSGHPPVITAWGLQVLAAAGAEVGLLGRLAPTRQRAAAHLLQLGPGGHLLGEQRGLDAVEDALQPADQLGLGDAQLGVRRGLALAERERDPLQLLAELRGQALLELADRGGVDVAQPVAAGVVQRGGADLLEQLLDHRADPHDLRRLLDHEIGRAHV